MSEFEHAMLWAVVIITASAHLIHLLDQLLGWPQFLVRLLEKRRQREVAEALRELGITPATKAAVQAAVRNDAVSRYNDPKERCMTFLRTCTSSGKYLVGSVEAKMFPYFTDVMAECLKFGRTDECVHILTSYLRSQNVNLKEIDLVVGIKGGAPTIAFSLAERLEKPLALFRGSNQYKYNPAEKRPATLFDGDLLVGKKAVIVDDSTTGGRKAFDCIDALRGAGVKVDEFWVMFEPLGKKTREHLKEQKGVTLRSVVTMDDATIAQLLTHATVEKPQ